jgi:hypothetical protein
MISGKSVSWDTLMGHPGIQKSVGRVCHDKIPGMVEGFVEGIF